jgi:hypothetical protein
VIGEVLKVGGSEAQRAKTVEEAFDKARAVGLYIFPHCNTEQLNLILVKATREGKWEMVGEVLKVGGSEAQRAKTIEEACDKVFNANLGPTLLLTRTNTFRDLGLLSATATERKGRHVAGEGLKVGGSEAQHVKTTEEACDRASDLDIICYILPHCNTILPHCNTILPHCNTILSQCNTEQLDLILAKATREGRWGMVGEVLKMGGSEAQRAKTIEEACDRAEALKLKNYILPHCNTILSQCNTEQLNRILATATRGGKWEMAGEVLKLGGSEAQCAKTVEKACGRTSDSELKYYILSQCNTEQLDRILATTTREGRWEMVGEVLKMGGSEAQRAKTIEEAYDRTRTSVFRYCILPHCNTEELDRRLATATKKKVVERDR